MKKVMLSLLSLSLIFMMGCRTIVNMRDSSRASKAMSEAFIEPKPSEWVLYQNILTEYFHYRNQSVIENDISILYEQYPALSDNISVEEGINIEGYELKSYNEGLNLIDANFDLEHYDRLKVNMISGNEAVLLVHGLNLYMTDDFGESGGEFIMEVHLREYDGKWEIILTDEFIPMEDHQ